MIIDISKTGAKLGTPPNALDLSDKFTRILGRVTVARRPCKVGWHQEKLAGVLFASVNET